MELWGLKDVSYLKYYNTLEWESRFTLGPKAAKNIDYIEKWFKWKLRKIKFPSENLVEAYVYLLQEWTGGIQRLAIVILSIQFENESETT